MSGRHAATGWEYKVRAEFLPARRDKSVEEVVEDQLRGTSKKFANKNREGWIRAEREARAGKSAEGEALFVATPDLWYASVIGPVLGGDSSCSAREMRREGATLKYLTGNLHARVVRGDSCEAHSTLAAQWVLARWLDPEATHLESA